VDNRGVSPNGPGQENASPNTLPVFLDRPAALADCDPFARAAGPENAP
jgi:hypothetical protein